MVTINTATWEWDAKRMAYFSPDGKHLIREISGPLPWELHTNFATKERHMCKHGSSRRELEKLAETL